jgi:hypothetical protein
VDFVEFPKIARYAREAIVTEKIDGTNGCIGVADDGTVLAGSRNRWIPETEDAFGFRRWVQEHADELRTLGPGRHYGEWWGSGIQRGYGLQDKRFSLFNVSRWAETRPACCGVVPVLWRGNMDDLHPGFLLKGLQTNGSYAAPGFMRPEGIVIFHVAGGYLFKKTIERDAEPKGREANHGR